MCWKEEAETRLVLRFDVELDFLAGECADSSGLLASSSLCVVYGAYLICILAFGNYVFVLGGKVW